MVTLQSLLRDKAFYRDVAQLVAHYVRDVGVGRSSRLFPTKPRLTNCLSVVSFGFCVLRSGLNKDRSMSWAILLI